MRKILFFCLLSTASAATFSVDPGSHRWGNTFFTLPNTVTVTTSGSPSSTQRGYVFSSADGVLSISLPPGVTGSCAGAPCNVFTTQTGNAASHYIAGSHQMATATDGATLYWIDPIFNTTTSQVGSVSLEANAQAPTANEPFAVGAYETDIKFKSTQNGYILGLRFYRVAADTDNSPIGTLYTDTGTSLASKTFSVSGTGWQTVYFDTPVAITAGTWYRASKFDAVGSPYRDFVFLNSSMVNGPLASASTFVGSNGSCDSTDSWPQTSAGYGGASIPAAGIVGCVDYAVGGTISVVWPGNDYSAGNVGHYRGGTVEGAQMLLAGFGPGPYAGINTFVEESGNPWHHDDGAGSRFGGRRGDYYYYRMTWSVPDWARLGSASSDGLRFWTRQNLEWKGGNRIYIGGSVLEGGHNDVVGSSLTISFGNQLIGCSDINFENNIVRSVAGFANMGAIYNGGLLRQTTAAPIQARMRISNNEFFDIGPYAAYAPGTHNGNGWFLEYPGGSEDMQIDHNTLLAVRGNIASLFWFGSLHTEGYSVTNNILPIANNDSARYGGGGETGPGTNCGNGELGITTCSTSSWSNYVFQKNLLYPENYSVQDTVGFDAGGGRNTTYTSTTTAAQIQSNWPTLKNSNYIPAGTDQSTYGWFKTPSLNSNTGSHLGGFDPHITSSSIFRAGGSFATTDNKPIGVDVQALRDAQGYVDHIGVPASTVTTNSATVVFAAPDSQGCPVDFKIFDSTDPNIINGFTRIADSGTGRVRNVQLTGLTSGQTYSYRIDCAANQPTGVFRTR
jgi:hypothetical protein